MALIKSHSNYILRKNHQTISDGTIWEHDITTIGGVNQFANDQIPIYKSSNFIITVRSDDKAANQYNKTKWKENQNGDIWTLENISGITSDLEEQNDVKLVLKQDYYDFCDFAYYGSLNEMFRASINDVLIRFPGELYTTNENTYYTSSVTIDFESIDEKILLGNSGLTYISNPFGIDIHSIKKPLDGKEIKYFADNGYENYEIFIDITDNETHVDSTQSGIPITNWEVEYYENVKFCPGNHIANVKINNTIEIQVYVGDNNEIVYLSNNIKTHIRPKEKFITQFYNECNNFEKIILNNKTTPKYKAIFSVIKENERGFYREMEEFIFPTSYGGYNIDASSYGFNEYTDRLAEIGEYYDEQFTDNLYRSMTHEAIKNFDWTYTREFNQGDEEEYVHGGEKIQKALRIFAREFDEILSYIDNIKNINRVTYDERSNIPDYFLIDVVENSGWDTKLVYPYDLIEYKSDEFGNYILDDDGNKIVFDNYSGETVQLNGYEGDETKTYFVRSFYQNAKKEINPYSKKYVGDFPDGYFVSCNCTNDNDLNGKTPCQYESSDAEREKCKYVYINAENSGTTLFDDGKLKNRVKSYTDERVYSYFDANNEFMRRMAINSPYILRHKGTVEGIEMILGMFGLKSKKWVDRLPNNCFKDNYTPDYEISEFSSFTNRIEEKWDAVHQMYRYDWINSTKLIVYNYRTSSNYSSNSKNYDYIPYQGLPVTYRYEEVSSGCDPYIKVSPLNEDPEISQSVTSNANDAFKNGNESNEPVLRRYLYPNFDKYEQLDGNPYFQMGGGWLSKTICNESGDVYNFQFDVDDNIAYNNYVASGVTYNEGVIDNYPIYKETVRNIKRVDKINDLLSIPSNDLKNGSIYYVSNIENNIAIINGRAYTINFEYKSEIVDSNNDKPLRYISLVKNDNYIQVGYDKFFNELITVYNEVGSAVTYTVSDKEYGYEVKAYIKEDDSFICKSTQDGYDSIDSFAIFNSEITSAATNYFIINDTYYSNRIDVKNEGTGWRILYQTDPEYIKINSIENYYEGNNPHNGNMSYNGGHEYFTYYKRLFKHAIDNDLFDDRCYNDYFISLDNEISKIGFKNLIDENEMITQYFPYISGLTETKVHYFGTYYKRDNNAKMESATTCSNVVFYGANQNKITNLKNMYNNINSDITVSGYILSNNDYMIGGSPYSAQTGTIDEITNQVVNNKRLNIKFYLHNPWQSNKGQCEIKYLDDIVMNYLTQMIPSTSIVEIQYVNGKPNTKK